MRALKVAVALIAIAMSLYHMHAAAFGPPEALIFRGTHLLFALTLVFLLYPARPGGAPLGEHHLAAINGEHQQRIERLPLALAGD